MTPMPFSTPAEVPLTVDIEAPCAMEAGFRFMATSPDNSESFPVTVPPGGVKKGEIFSVPLPASDGASEVTPFFVNSHYTASADAPLGRWKDGLFDCCRFGLFHSSFLNGFCCPQILMAQVLTRFKMNWLAVAAPDWRGTFYRISGIVAIYWTLTIFMGPPASRLVYNEETGASEWVSGETQSPILVFLYHVSSWGLNLYTLFVLTRLRRKVRLRYEIPTSNGLFGGECEDCCVSFWCGPCSIAQIARQTCDYNTQSAACCSSSGLGASLIKPHEAALTV